MRRALALLVLPLLLAAAVAGEPREVHRDDFLRVEVEQATVGSDTVAKLVSESRAAWAFIRARNAWRDDAALRAPLSIELLTPDELKARKHEKALGVAIGRDRILVRLRPGLDFSPGTLAHEFTHMQDHRLLASVKPRLPDYLAEGRAILAGLAWRRERGLGLTSYDETMARRIGRATPDQVKLVLESTKKDPARPTGFLMESIGAEFVEFLRTGLGPEGAPDAEGRLARVIEDLAAGRSVDDAFGERFPISLATARARLLAHVASTAHHPTARLHGTVWETTLAGRGILDTSKDAGKKEDAPPDPEGK
jgi:hypothetical protein